MPTNPRVKTFFSQIPRFPHPEFPRSATDLSVVRAPSRLLKTDSPESILAVFPLDVSSFPKDSTNSYAEHVYRALRTNP